MLTLERTETDATADEAVREQLRTLDASIVDGKVWNPAFMWKTAKELQHTDITGDGFVLALTLASMTRRPGQGCRATHAQIARRMATLKQLFRLAHEIGWPRLLTILGTEENYVS